MKRSTRIWLWILWIVIVFCLSGGSFYYIQSINSPPDIERDHTFVLPLFQQSSATQGVISVLDVNTGVVTRHRVAVPKEWKVQDVVAIDDHTVILRGGEEFSAKAYYDDIDDQAPPFDLGIYARDYSLIEAKVSPDQKYFAIQFMASPSETYITDKIALFKTHPLDLKGLVNLREDFANLDTIDNDGNAFLYVAGQVEWLLKYSLRDEGRLLWRKEYREDTEEQSMNSLRGQRWFYEIHTDSSGVTYTDSVTKKKKSVAVNPSFIRYMFSTVNDGVKVGYRHLYFVTNKKMAVLDFMSGRVTVKTLRFTEKKDNPGKRKGGGYEG